MERCILFFVLLWFWHMPVPYDSDVLLRPAYWAMHVTLFGSAILLWRELLQSVNARTLRCPFGRRSDLDADGSAGRDPRPGGAATVLWHLTTTQAWGLTPLQDQQLGGIFMWVPGILLFLWAAVRASGGCVVCQLVQTQ